MYLLRHKPFLDFDNYAISEFICNMNFGYLRKKVSQYQEIAKVKTEVFEKLKGAGKKYKRKFFEIANVEPITLAKILEDKGVIKRETIIIDDETIEVDSYIGDNFLDDERVKKAKLTDKTDCNTYSVSFDENNYKETEYAEFDYTKQTRSQFTETVDKFIFKADICKQKLIQLQDRVNKYNRTEKYHYSSASETIVLKNMIKCPLATVISPKTNYELMLSLTNMNKSNLRLKRLNKQRKAMMRMFYNLTGLRLDNFILYKEI